MPLAACTWFHAASLSLDTREPYSTWLLRLPLLSCRRNRTTTLTAAWYHVCLPKNYLSRDLLINFSAKDIFKFRRRIKLDLLHARVDDYRTNTLTNAVSCSLQAYLQAVLRPIIHQQKIYSCTKTTACYRI